MGKKKTTTKRSRPTKAPKQRPQKTLLPADNPLLRHQADEASRQGGPEDERERARLRLKALKQTRDMPTSDSEEGGSDPGRRR